MAYIIERDGKVKVARIRIILDYTMTIHLDLVASRGRYLHTR